MTMPVTKQRRTTIDDVARHAGTSKCTASRALASKGYIAQSTLNAVREAAKELGYEPNIHAKRLLNGAHDVVDLVCFRMDLDVGVRKNILIERLLTDKGFDVPNYSFRFGDDSRVTALLSKIRRERPRAIVCGNWIPEIAYVELQKYVDDGGIVVVYDTDCALNCDKVVFDRFHNTYTAAKHLIDLGHRKIGFYNNWKVIPPDRLAGFRTALQEVGRAPRPDWIFVGQYEEGGAAAAHQYLGLEDRPTAMCMVNDYAAVAFVAEIQRAGVRVPQDLSVVSHDNLPIAQYSATPLTTMTHPIEPIAHAVFDLLNDAIEHDGTQAPRTITCRGELIERGSAIPYQEK